MGRESDAGTGVRGALRLVETQRRWSVNAYVGIWILAGLVLVLNIFTGLVVPDTRRGQRQRNRRPSYCPLRARRGAKGR